MQLLFTLSFVSIAFILSFAIGLCRANYHLRKEIEKINKASHEPITKQKTGM